MPYSIGEKPTISSRSSPPFGAQEGDLYFDDGTNTGDGNPTWRRYDGNKWVNLGTITGEGNELIYNIDSAQDKWTITHNLERKPEVNVVIGGEKVEAKVNYIDENSLEIIFSKPQTGKAYLIY